MKIKIDPAHVDALLKDKIIFLNFLKSIVPVFHNSNIFYRDIQYGIQKFLLLKGFKAKNEQCEQLTDIVAKELIQENFLRPMNPTTWLVNYPPYAAGAPHTYELSGQEAQQ